MLAFSLLAAASQAGAQRQSASTPDFEPQQVPATPTNPAEKSMREKVAKHFNRRGSMPRDHREGGRVEEIRPGDVVWFPPGEKHWHGATPTTAMTHIAIQEKLNGKVVDWMEHVTDEQYRKE